MPQLDVFEADAALEGVPSALAAARDGIDAILRDRGLRTTTSQLAAEALLAGAAASATLDGSQTDLDALRDGGGDEIAMSAARLNAGLLAMVPVIGRSPVQAFARLHTLAASGHVPDAELGRPRPGSDAAARLQRLAAALATPTQAPALAVAAIAHAEFACAEPFEAFNEMVGRAVERLVLVARGIDRSCVLVPEAGHLAMRDSYRDALALYAEGMPEGRRQWLLYAAEAATAALEFSPVRPK